METKPLTEKERIEALSLYLDISIRRLAQITGMSEATFYHISDNSRFGISERTASRICYQLEKQRGIVVNRDWLLSGEGEMIIKDASVAPQNYESKREHIMQMAAERRDDSDPTDYKEKYLRLLEDYSALQKEHTALLIKLQQ